MSREFVGFKCKNCGYFLDKIEVELVVFNIFAECFRSHAQNPFEPVFKEVER